MRPRYLISCISVERARGIAKAKGLKKDEWLHIPLTSGNIRDKLRGCKVPDESYLIGYFSDEERTYLLEHTKEEAV